MESVSFQLTSASLHLCCTGYCTKNNRGNVRCRDVQVCQQQLLLVYDILFYMQGIISLYYSERSSIQTLILNSLLTHTTSHVRLCLSRLIFLGYSKQVIVIRRIVCRISCFWLSSALQKTRGIEQRRTKIQSKR